MSPGGVAGLKAALAAAERRAEEAAKARDRAWEERRIVEQEWAKDAARAREDFEAMAAERNEARQDEAGQRARAEAAEARLRECEEALRGLVHLADDLMVGANERGSVWNREECLRAARRALRSPGDHPEDGT